MKEYIKTNLKNIDWIFFGVLLFVSISPIFIKIFRTFLINDMSGLDDYSIAVSWGYLYLIFEAISIFVITPIYAFIKKNTKSTLEIKEKTIIAYIFAFISSILMIVFISLLSIWIGQKFANDNNVDFSVVYTYLLIFGSGMAIHLLTNAILSYVILNKKKLNVIIIIFINTFITMSTDFLFLSNIVNPNASIETVGLSVLVSSLISLTFIILITYLPERKEWNYSFKSISFSKWKDDYKLYSGSSMWLGFEAVFWNILYVLGVTLWLSYGSQEALGGLIQRNDWESAFWTMDGLFWGGLLVPTMAVNLFIAENISKKETTLERREVIKSAMLLNIFVLLTWVVLIPIILFVLFPIVLSNEVPFFNSTINLNKNMIEISKTLSLVIVGFFIFQLPSRTLYTYFSATGQGFKVFLGTIIGATPVWLTSMIVYFANVPMDNYEWISIIYGLGLLSIFIVYYSFWWAEKQPWYSPKEDGVWSKLTNYKQNVYLQVNSEIY